jgi:hypothetical protein
LPKPRIKEVEDSFNNKASKEKDKFSHQEKKKLSADFRLVISASGAGQAPLTSEQHHW